MNKKLNTILWKRLYNHLVKNCFIKGKHINVDIISSIEIHAISFTKWNLEN